MTIDTIVARATPPGKGGVGIVRVSGPQSAMIARQMLGHLPEARKATHSTFLTDDNAIIDEGIAIFFKGPYSFTGEDVLELQGHGGMVVIDQLITRILQFKSVRIARPGEFSERAFLNDKLDLVQAEAIADLIDATSTQAAISAVRSLQGDFSKKINHLVKSLIKLRMYVESAIDFPEEEVDFLADELVQTSLVTIINEVDAVLRGATQGALIREGVSVVIAGKPNAGKSSLLNALSGRESAIVTDIPGTTRDVLREYIHVDGIPLHIIDTAGLRESDDEVEKIGVQRATNEIQQADIVLLIVDGTNDEPLKFSLPNNITSQAKLIVIHNKIDVTDQAPHVENHPEGPVVFMSVKKALGMDLLISQLKIAAGAESFSENTFIARSRHIEALNKAKLFLDQGEHQLREHKAGELLAEDLRGAQTALSEITGEFTSDDLLGVIFSEFCIGK